MCHSAHDRIYFSLYTLYKKICEEYKAMKKITLCLIVLIATILLGCDQLYEVGVYSREAPPPPANDFGFGPGTDPSKWVQIKYADLININGKSQLELYQDYISLGDTAQAFIVISNLSTVLDNCLEINSYLTYDETIKKFKLAAFLDYIRTIGDLQNAISRYNQNTSAGEYLLEANILDDGTFVMKELPPAPFITIEKASYINLDGSLNSDNSSLLKMVTSLLGYIAYGSYSSVTKTYNLDTPIKIKTDFFNGRPTSYNENLLMGEKVIKASFSNGLLTMTEVKEAPTTNVTHVEYIDLDGVYGSRVFSSLSNSDYFTYKYHLQDVIFEILDENTSIKNVSSNGFVLPDPIATRKRNIEGNVASYNRNRQAGEKTIEVSLSDNGTLTIIENKEVAQDIVIKSVSITYLDGKTSLQKYNALSSSEKQPYILEMGKYVQAVIAEDCALSFSSSSFVTTPNISTTDLKVEANAESYNENLRQGKARVSTSFNNSTGALTIREVELVE